MGTAKQRRKRRTRVLFIASLVVLPSGARAGSWREINLGAPTDAAGDTAVGYTAYEIDAVADTGDEITGIDAGSSGQGYTFGLSGVFLQERRINQLGVAVSTPVSSDENGDPLGLDSHFIILPSARSNLAEDTNGIAPPGVPSSPTAAFGLGTYLRGTFTIASQNWTAVQPVAYIVVPNYDQQLFLDLPALYSPLFNFNVSETSVTTGKTTLFNASYPIAIGQTRYPVVTGPYSVFSPYYTSTLNSSNSIFSTPTPISDAINIFSTSTSANPPTVHIDAAGGVDSGAVEVVNQSLNVGPLDVAFKLDVGGVPLDPSDVRVASLISEINVENPYVTAAPIPVGEQSALPGYDLSVTGLSLTGDDYVGFNFPYYSGNNLPEFDATDLAVIPASVPEPACLSVFIAVGLMLATGHSGRWRPRVHLRNYTP